MTALRVSGTPLEHVLGWADFAGVRVPVDPGVFVPRPRSEFLVECAVQGLEPGSLLVDLCCGSGAIAAAVASRVPVRVFASDLDPRATANARRTLRDLDATVVEGDLWDPLPESIRGKVNAVTIVAPYVPTAQIDLLPHEARDYEPLTALDGGDDGLHVLRRAIAGAPQWLAPGARFLTEVAEHQVPATVDALQEAGLAPLVLTRDGSPIVVGRG